MSDEIRINTDSLRSYAGQLDSIQRQIYALNAEIRSFRYHTGKLWNVNTYGYEWTINPAKSYCVDTANEFESIERYLQGCDPEMYEGNTGWFSAIEKDKNENHDNDIMNLLKGKVSGVKKVVYDLLLGRTSVSEMIKSATRIVENGIDIVKDVYTKWHKKEENRSEKDRGVDISYEDIISTGDKVIKQVWDVVTGVLSSAPIMSDKSKEKTEEKTEETPSSPVEVKNGDIIGYSANGAPRYKLPDYVYQGLEPDANGVWGENVSVSEGKPGHIATWNYNGTLSCTYYTLRKLKERGLSFPCNSGGPGNGGKWFDNFDTNSGAPSFGGANALEDMVNKLTLPQENIVVSFPESYPWGHVLLIDRIFKDENGNVMIEWSDTWPYMYSPNDKNDPETKTLEEFKRTYASRGHGNTVGIVVVGAGSR
ncbi:MAG: hypothetical protein IJD02_02580 [Lachnospiraceae bacterium]|nr:hypothetical protein [Lachnospiraceae bacterium]